MAIDFEAGDRITILFFAGKTLDVVVAHDEGEAMLICSPYEFERAQREGRQPASIEYPKGYVRSRHPSERTERLVESGTSAT